MKRARAQCARGGQICSGELADTCFFFFSYVFFFNVTPSRSETAPGLAVLRAGALTSQPPGRNSNPARRRQTFSLRLHKFLSYRRCRAAPPSSRLPPGLRSAPGAKVVGCRGSDGPPGESGPPPQMFEALRAVKESRNRRCAPAASPLWADWFGGAFTGCLTADDSIGF